MDWFSEDDNEAGDYDDPRGGGMTFDMVESYEVSRTLQLLNKSEDRLFDLSLQPTPKAKAPENDYDRQYYSEGYEANYECADDTEILRWQRWFPHLRVVAGKGRDNEVQQQASKRKDTLRSHIDCDSANRALIAAGMKVGSLGVAEEEEEIIAQDGVLEDQMEGSSIERSSQSVQQNAVVQQLWPEVVQQLRPLIRKVLQNARDRNLPNSLDALEALARQQAQSSRMDDDGW